MMQGDDAGRIDQYISSALRYIPLRLPQSLPLQDLLQVSPPCFGAPYVPKGGGEHPVAPVGFAGVVDQEGPGQGSFLDVASGKEAALKRDHRDFHVPPGEFLFPITQLRDVRPARESAEVTVEHHQQPAPSVRFERVASSFAVTMLERCGGHSGQVDHAELLRKVFFPL